MKDRAENVKYIINEEMGFEAPKKLVDALQKNKQRIKMSEEILGENIQKYN